MRTGSLQNMLADTGSNPVVPEVGMGGTVIGWTDRHAVTIVEVSPSGHKIVAQYDTATRTDGRGMTDAQTYSFERNPNGRTETFTRRKDGAYRVVGGTSRCMLGHRDHYHDFSF